MNEPQQQKKKVVDLRAPVPPGTRLPPGILVGSLDELVMRRYWARQGEERLKEEAGEKVKGESDLPRV